MCVCVRYALCCCSWWRSLRKQHADTKTTLGHAQTPNEIRHWTVKTNSNVFDFVTCVCVCVCPVCVCVRICINFFNYMFVNGISDLFVNEVTYNEAKQSTKQNEWSCMRGTAGGVVVVYGELKKKRISCYCCCCPEGIYRKFQRHYLWTFKIGVIYSCQGGGSSVMSWIPNAKSSAGERATCRGRRGRKGAPNVRAATKCGWQWWKHI